MIEIKASQEESELFDFDLSEDAEAEMLKFTALCSAITNILKMTFVLEGHHCVWHTEYGQVFVCYQAQVMELIHECPQEIFLALLGAAGFFGYKLVRTDAENNSFRNDQEGFLPFSKVH
jgi:hypothetical protein